MKKQRPGIIMPSVLSVLVAMLFIIPQVYAVETAQPVCVPRVPASTTMTVDGSDVGDWDSFTPLSIGYAADPAGNISTRLAADSTYLYFYTEVTTTLSAPQVQAFFIGVDADGGPKMLQIQPFQAGDTAPMAANSIPQPPLTQILGSSWTAWTDPTPPNGDFFRVMENSPAEKWILEGRVNLAHIGITGATPIDNFNLFLYVDASFGATSVQRYWPDQGGGFVDLSTPASLTFGENRCPDITFSQPYINYGKTLLNTDHDTSLSITNNGVAGSQLQIQSGSLNPGGSSAFSLLSLTKDGVGSSPPFNLAQGQSATAFLRYHPTTGTTIASPHETELRVQSNDPEEPLATLNVQGNGRRYIDTVLILDQSGSMLSQNKWATTEWASEISAEIVRLFKFDSDRLGIVGFGGTSSSPDAFERRPLTTFPTSPSSFMSTVPDADSTFFTPIGLGIEEAHNMFSADSRDHVAILMSDGKHNRPTSTLGATTVEDLDLPFAVESNTKSMRIHTVALGTDSGVSTVLLNDIRSHYNPMGATLTPLTTYNISEDPNNLAELFIEPLMEQMIVNRIDFDVDPMINGYPVESGAHSVLAIVAWQQGSAPQDIQVEVYDQSGTGLPINTYNSAHSGYYKGPNSSQPYTYVLIDDINDLAENRVWRIKDSMGNPIAPPVGIPFVLVDLNIKAFFNVKQEFNGTGNDIIAEANLSEVGTAITNTADHHVTVDVLIGKPDEGFGTYVSTHDVDTCDTGSPSLPPVPGAGKPGFDIMATVGRDFQVPPVSSSATTGPGTTAVDPPSLPFQKIDALFANCGKSDLSRSRLPGEPMYDDGTHGDKVAGDGIYTLRFANTEYEGSYTFQFHVKGTSPAGARFTRVRNLSTHLSVDVDPEETIFDSRLLGQSGANSVVEYYVTPRDKFGGYMGPGYPKTVQFTASAGSWQGPVRDYNNGIYSRILSYNTSQPEPEVSVSVQGKPITSRGKSYELVPFLGYTSFDSALSLDDGLDLGLRFNYRWNQQIYFGVEAAVTGTENALGDSGNFIQIFANIRYQPAAFNSGKIQGYLAAGAGQALFRGFSTDDEAFASHVSAGLTYDIKPNLGLRFEARAINVQSVYSVGSTTSTQANFGLVFRF